LEEPEVYSTIEEVTDEQAVEQTIPKNEEVVQQEIPKKEEAVEQVIFKEEDVVEQEIPKKSDVISKEEVKKTNYSMSPEHQKFLASMEEFREREKKRRMELEKQVLTLKTIKFDIRSFVEGEELGATIKRCERLVQMNEKDKSILLDLKDIDFKAKIFCNGKEVKKNKTQLQLIQLIFYVLD
jgi:hypothetical protein